MYLKRKTYQKRKTMPPIMKGLITMMTVYQLHGDSYYKRKKKAAENWEEVRAGVQKRF